MASHFKKLGTDLISPPAVVSSEVLGVAAPALLAWAPLAEPEAPEAEAADAEAGFRVAAGGCGRLRAAWVDVLKPPSLWLGPPVVPLYSVLGQLGANFLTPFFGWEGNPLLK